MCANSNPATSVGLARDATKGAHELNFSSWVGNTC